MIHDTDHLVGPPADPDLAWRVSRLRELGLESRPYQAFDELASRLARAVGAADGYAMVNFIGPTEQYFVGLYTPSGSQGGVVDQAAAAGQPGRTMGLDHGFCPYVVERKKAMPLRDVCDYPRFAGNPVVDEIGIRSYLGAPLIDSTGTPLGTICVVATEPHPWRSQEVDTIKSMAAEAMDLIHKISRRG